ncbi:PTS sugar transporter subunit IIB [Erwinia pyri]|uniref:PTS sugar transporter subunit IIB n=1 Tax=Erwinia pyri TaxID=3062598 RepID=A0AA50HL15_9GAMM|nr:PTS sugar transporter subunit IIB [Erwinia sp. DE2]WLS76957.1 PTS sugar transporter subunit IIB [Erwinia sp. DE2]
MAISFIRIDDRVIHGQLITRWAKEYACEGIIAIDDDVANDPFLSQVMKGAVSDVKVWLFTTETAIEKLSKVILSEKKYFIISKSPVTLSRLIEAGISLNNGNNCINVGPMSAREGTTVIGPNQSVTEQEIKAFRFLASLGYEIDFRLVPDGKSYSWPAAEKKLLTAGG